MPPRKTVMSKAPEIIVLLESINFEVSIAVWIMRLQFFPTFIQLVRREVKGLSELFAVLVVVVATFFWQFNLFEEFLIKYSDLTVDNNIQNMVIPGCSFHCEHFMKNTIAPPFCRRIV